MTAADRADARPLVDADVAAVLAEEAAGGLPLLSTLDPRSARAQDALVQARRSAGHPLPAVASAADAVLAGVLVRVVTPLGEGPFPIVVHLHGGGWVVGSPATYDLPVRRLAAETRAVVVDVDYRLAPEHPYPAALDDAWAVLQEVAGWGRPVAVAGDSGGGALAAALTLLARPADLPTYPSVSLVQAWPSWRECAVGGGLDPADSRWFADCWAPPPLDRADPFLSTHVSDHARRVAARRGRRRRPGPAARRRPGLRGAAVRRGRAGLRDRGCRPGARVPADARPGRRQCRGGLGARCPSASPA